MEDKNKIIFEYQNRQKALKNEIINSKKKLPRFIIGFIFLTFVSFYFLEDKFYNFFENGVDYIFSGIVFLSVFCLFFIFKNFNSVRKKEKEVKSIGSKLYNLMKLETDTTDE